MSGDQVLHIGIPQCSCNSKNAINAVVENQTTSAGNPTAFILVATLVVVREAKCSAITAENNTRIAHVGRIQHALSTGLVP